MKPFFLSLLLWLAATTAYAASIAGAVSDENGLPIEGSVMCLSKQKATPSAAPACLQSQTTDGAGRFAFTAMAAGTYVVTITDDRFPTFTWLPAARTLSVTASAQVAGLDFKRQFSFSNFQNPVILRGADLPELAGFALDQDTVFVKVYAVDPADPAQQMVFFMGRVTSAESLKFTAYAPWTVKEVIYEIFSPTAAYQGSLLIHA